MKTLTKIALLALTLGTAGFASAADGLSFSGDVHAANALEFRGHPISQGEPSIGLKLHANHATGLYATLSSDTVKLPNPQTGDVGLNKHQLKNDVTFGYRHQLPEGITAGAEVTSSLVTGGDNASDYSFTEVAGFAKWNGVTAKVSRVVESADARLPGLVAGDVYAEVGYTHDIGNYHIGADLGWAWYDQAKQPGTEDGLALAKVRVAYDVTKDVTVQLSHQIGGHDPYGNSSTGNHKTYVKAQYKF